MRNLVETRILAIVLAVGQISSALAANRYNLAFSTYICGMNGDYIRDVCADNHGNIIAVGGTSSPDFPTTAGAYCRTYHTGGKSLGDFGPMDVFVMKFSPSGQLLWSTLFGGPNYDRAYGVEVDNRGFIYVAGRAGEGLPIKPGVFQVSFVDTVGTNLGAYGKQNGFVAKFTPDGQLMWASYVGSGQLCRDIAVDDQGEIYLPSGWNGIGQAPPASWFANGYQKTPKGDGGDSCVLKIKSDGSRVLWGTWLCGSGTDNIAAMVRVDAHRNVYYANNTASTDMPTPGNGRHTYSGGPNDFYVAKLSPDGSNLIYGTYLGGSGDEEVDTHELAVDAQGNAYVAVWTTSTDWSVTHGVFQPNPGGGSSDLAICKIGPDGAILACSYLAGSGHENAEGLSVDSSGNVYVTGTTYSANFPTAGIPYQSAYGGANGRYDGNAFLTIIAPDLKNLVYSSFVGKQCSITGQNAYGGFHASALSPDGSWIVGGSWYSSNWPTLQAFQSTYNPRGNGHAVLARFVPVSRDVQPRSSDRRSK
ncbi:MAG TPA: SBBP repeat-containing protein [Terriglobia bacterium]|nr:SBBP repeat-containing protein [Terriglobia bacterium]